MNAIILAAGLGFRLSFITLEKPKPLLKINGVTIIEKQISYLQEIGITEIYIVVGYKSEHFQYLISCYGVKLIYNKDFEKFNNIYSLYLARHVIGNSYILDGDVFLFRNILDNRLSKSTYFSRCAKKLDGEWMLECTGNVLQNIIIKGKNKVSGNLDSAYIISGISYWTMTDATIIKEAFKRLIDTSGTFRDPDCESFFWDHIIYQNLEKLSIDVIKLNDEDILEIDNFEDLSNIHEYSTLETFLSNI